MAQILGNGLLTNAGSPLFNLVGLGEDANHKFSSNSFVLILSVSNAFLGREMTTPEVPNENEDSVAQCPICFSKLEGQPIAVFRECHHEFCFFCILLLLGKDAVSSLNLF